MHTMKLMMRLLLLLLAGLFLSAATGQECEDGTVRLVPTDLLQTANTGRLEICLNQRWGTISVPDEPNYFWPLKNVLVACHQMNYTSGLTAIPPEQVTLDGQLMDTSSQIPVHYTDVSCDGTETMLSDCTSTVLNGLSHSHDVYIVCLPGTETYSGLHTLPSGTVIEGDLRLVGSTTNGRGAVEIYSRLGWTSICPDEEWTDSDASVVCQRLGYDSGSRDSVTLEPEQIAPRQVYRADCSNSGGSVGSGRVTAGPCTFLADSAQLCPSTNRYAGVICRNEGSDVARLFRQAFESDRVHGILEVRYNGHWGPVCVTGSGTRLAGIVCEGFGYSRNLSTALVLPESQRSVESRLKPIWLRDLMCTRFSPSSFDCTHDRPLGYGACPVIFGVNCVSSPPYQLSASSIVAICFGTFVGVVFLCWCAVFICKSCNSSESSPSTPNGPMTANQRVSNFVRRVSLDLFNSRSQSDLDTVRQNAELFTYKAPPPSYRSAAKFPALDEESPPPYRSTVTMSEEQPPPPPPEEDLPPPPPFPSSPPAEEEEGDMDIQPAPVTFTVPTGSPPSSTQEGGIGEMEDPPPPPPPPPSIYTDGPQPDRNSPAPPVTITIATPSRTESDLSHTHPVPNQTPLGIPV